MNLTNTGDYPSLAMSTILSVMVEKGESFTSLCLPNGALADLKQLLLQCFQIDVLTAILKALSQNCLIRMYPAPQQCLALP